MEAGPCLQQQRLIDIVQEHLIRIIDLTRATADALANQNEHFALELDREVEREIGKKERALGALRQHRIEHKC